MRKGDTMKNVSCKGNKYVENKTDEMEMEMEGYIKLTYKEKGKQ